MKNNTGRMHPTPIGRRLIKNKKTNCVGILKMPLSATKEQAVKKLVEELVGIELKSLILAQIERWRHA